MGLIKSGLTYYLKIDLLCVMASAAHWFNPQMFRVLPCYSFHDFLYRMSSGVWLCGYCCGVGDMMVHGSMKPFYGFVFINCHTCWIDTLNAISKPF